MANWTDRYIGIPFQPGGRTMGGCDCGGLVLLVLQQEKGIVASDFNAYSRKEFGNMKGMSVLAQGIEDLMEEEWKHVENPLPFDLVRYRYGRWPSHVGIYARPGKILHVEEGQGFARIIDVDDIRWKPRFIEYRRHVQLTQG